MVGVGGTAPRGVVSSTEREGVYGARTRRASSFGQQMVSKKGCVATGPPMAAASAAALAAAACAASCAAGSAAAPLAPLYSALAALERATGARSQHGRRKLSCDGSPW